MTTAQKHNLSFPDLSDVGIIVNEVFGPVHDIDAANVAAYKRRGHDLPSSAQREGAGILPLQAIHRINQQRQVRFAFVSADYITLAQPANVYAAIRRL